MILFRLKKNENFCDFLFLKKLYFKVICFANNSIKNLNLSETQFIRNF
jgi:hypothetical protein